VVVGHSAGAAILARLCLDGAIAPALLVSLNGALLPFDGAARFLFPSMAKLLFLNPFAPRFFAWSADATAVANLLRGTGSRINKRGVDLYARLLRNPAHVAGALGMMANWDLTELHRELPQVKTKVALLVGEDDKAVPPDGAKAIAAQIPEAAIETIRRAGHLAHEEKPEEVYELILRHATLAGVI
jgi:magnesium chelatase accessory protein